MNVLIDTNIFIPLEDVGTIVLPDFADLRRLAEETEHHIYLHPAQAEDIARDSDIERKKIVSSRLKLYPQIPNPPDISEESLRNLGWSQTSENDRIDNLLLYALLRGAVHFFVTNDHKIHNKAKRANLGDQVYTLEQFLSYLKALIKEGPIPPGGVEERFLHEIDVDQNFFTSLRSSYVLFNEWYLEKAKEHRKAWCISENGVVFAICIFKEESNQYITDDLLLNGKILKLCTFKVDAVMRGRKLGERLLYAAFRYAHIHKFDFIYLHAFGVEQEKLISLLCEFGFVNAGKKSNDEDVYFKKMIPCDTEKLDPLNFSIKYYPNFRDDSSIAKYIVPIRPNYHEVLFPETSDFAYSLLKNFHQFYPPQANTIKKAYLSHSRLRDIPPGSLLLFYRSGDRRSIECMGVVERTIRANDISSVTPMISKRTVYSKDELSKILSSETLIIMFRLVKYFRSISYKKFASAEIKGNIQSLREISHEQYLALFKDNESWI